MVPLLLLCSRRTTAAPQTGQHPNAAAECWRSCNCLATGTIPNLAACRLLAVAAGGLFELHSFEQHSNMLRLRQVAELVELMGSMRFMQVALEAAPQKKKLFAREVRALAARHCHNFDDIQLPLVSKLYIMKRVG
jgi:hypothetical protein